MWTRRDDRGSCPLRRSLNRPHHGTERQPIRPARANVPRAKRLRTFGEGESRSARPARCSASSVSPTFGGTAETKKALTSLLQVTSPAFEERGGPVPSGYRSPGSFPASCPEILPTDTRPQARANLGERDLGDSACRRKRQFDENQGGLRAPANHCLAPLAGRQARRIAAHGPPGLDWYQYKEQGVSISMKRTPDRAPAIRAPLQGPE